MHSGEEWRGAQPLYRTFHTGGSSALALDSVSYPFRAEESTRMLTGGTDSEAQPQLA